MNLQTLTHQLDSLHNQPPFELWNPPFCGDIDMVIRADGQWLYSGTPITRIKLVKLFASVLLAEGDEYFLKTPAEKVRIQVEDAPFIIIDWRIHTTDSGPAIEVVSNIEHRVMLSNEHPLTISTDGSKPYVTLYGGMKALVHRNVYYQWVDIGTEMELEGKKCLVLESGGGLFSLGEIG